MHRILRLALPCVLIAVSCKSSGSTKSPAPAPSPSPSPQTGATPSTAQPTTTGAQPGRGGAPGGGGQQPGGRPPLTPEQRAAPRDSLSQVRAATVQQLMTKIAGRENDPASQVFKNVQI